MTFMQDLLSQLDALGLSSGNWSPGGQQSSFMDIANISPEQITESLTSQFGLSADDLNPSLFQSISSDLLKTGLGKTYRPQIEAKGGALLTDLQKQLSGKSGRQAFGGFAGSGQSQQFTEGAKDVYGQGMSSILAASGQQRAQGLQSVQDIINQWVETASDIKGW